MALKETLLGKTSSDRAWRVLAVVSLALGLKLTEIGNNYQSTKETLDNQSTKIAVLGQTATLAPTQTLHPSETPTATPTETATPSPTPTKTEVPTLVPSPTLEPTVVLDPSDSAYEWAVKQKIGRLENGVIVLDANDFRKLLKDWLMSKGTINGDRANIAIEMLSKPFGEKGMSTSHALDFWKKEGGRGWSPEDADHVFSFDELNSSPKEKLFSARNGEFRLGVVGQAGDIKTIVVRVVAERQLRLSHMQDKSPSEIKAFLKQTNIDKGIRQQASGLLRTVGVNVPANNLPGASDVFELRPENRMPNFALRITRGAAAKDRASQPETAECVLYQNDLEKKSAGNDETMDLSDPAGTVLVTYTEDATGKIVMDVFRLTNIKDKLDDKKVQPLNDSEVGKPAEVDAGRWLEQCLPASGAGKKATPVGPTVTPGGPTVTPGPTETPFDKKTPSGPTPTPYKTPEVTPTDTIPNQPNTAPTWTPVPPDARPTDVTYPTVVPTEGSVQVAPTAAPVIAPTSGFGN